MVNKHCMSVKMNTNVPFLLSSFFSKHILFTYQIANGNNIMHIVCALSKELLCSVYGLCHWRRKQCSSKGPFLSHCHCILRLSLTTRREMKSPSRESWGTFGPWKQRVNWLWRYRELGRGNMRKQDHGNLNEMP